VALNLALCLASISAEIEAMRKSNPKKGDGVAAIIEGSELIYRNESGDLVAIGFVVIWAPWPRVVTRISA
jgi:hypothetical protein